jgi:ATP-dependent helicase/nuclease subunit A
MEGNMSSQTFELTDKLIRAGAGAGKTTKLVATVIDVYSHFANTQKRWPRVVITTFTRKATQELRERLLKKGQELENEDLTKFILSPGHLHISTIHGVLHLFLKRFAHLVGIDDQFRLIDDGEEQELALKVFRGIYFSSSIDSVASTDFRFDEMTTLFRKIANQSLIDGEVRPLDFDWHQKITQVQVQESLKEYKTILQMILSETENKTWKEKSEAWLAALTHLRSPQELLALVSERSPGFKEDHYDPSVNDLFKKYREKVKKVFSLSEEDQLLLNKTHSDLGALFDPFQEAYLEMKRKSGVISMSDLENLSFSILKNQPDIGQLFSDDFDYWMIDEYQDTSPIQIKILGLLSRGRPQFMVGDPQQSIYLFRGAKKEVFSSRESSLKGQIDILNKNYRSEPSLLYFVNDLMSSMPGHFTRMEPKSNENIGSKVGQVLVSPDFETEIKSISARVVELLRSGVEPKDICILAMANDDLTKVGLELSQHSLPYQIHSAGGFYKRREILDFLSVGRFLMTPFNDDNLVQVLRSPYFRVSDECLAEYCSKPGSLWMEIQNLNDPAIEKLRHIFERSKSFGISEALSDLIQEMISVSYFADSSGRCEANLWKIFARLKEEERQPGFSYLSFFKGGGPSEDLDSIGLDVDAISALEPNRIHLMTIHASKGLEFDHVIVPFLCKTPQSAKKSDFVIKDGRFCTYGKDNDGEKIFSMPSQIEQQERATDESEEHLRKFYVAVTRAKKTLTLTRVEKAPDRSWAGLLNFDFTEGEHKGPNYIYSVRKEDWAHMALELEKPKLLPVPDKINFVSDAPVRSSVTALLAKSNISHKVETRNLNESIKVVSRGTLIHSILEKLSRSKMDLSQIFSGVESKGELALSKEAVQFVLDLKHPPMGELLMNGNPEWGFVRKKDKEISEGQIDLWGIVDGKLWIVDYKTGSEAHKLKAIEQLQSYADAVKQFTGMGSANLAVIYPFSKNVFIETEV